MKKLIWLFPIMFLIHDIEEIATIEEFVNNNLDMIPVRVSTLEFSIAFLLLWILTVVGCVKASNGRRFWGMDPVTFLTFLVPGIFLANGVGHILQFIFWGSYVPGIITTVIVILPYSVVTAAYLLSNDLVTRRKLLIFLVIGFFIQAPFAVAAIGMAKVLV